MAWHKPKDLRGWLTILQRHARKMFFTAVPVAVAVIIASFWLPREYAAEVRFERINDATLEQTNNPTIRRNLAAMRRVMHEEIKGYSAVEQLTDDLNLTAGLERHADGSLTDRGQQAKQDLINEIRNRLSVRLGLRSDQRDSIIVGYSDEDRHLAPQMVNTAVENYIRKTRQELDDMLLGASRFFEQQTQQFRKEVEDLEHKKLRFEADYRNFSVNDPGGLRARLEENRRLMQQLTEETEDARAELAVLREFIESEPEFHEQEVMVANPEVRLVQDQVQKLQTELDHFRYVMRRTDAHPAVVQLQVRIAELKQNLAELPAEVSGGMQRQPNEARAQMELRAQTLASQIDLKERRREEVAGQLQQLEALAMDFYRLRGEYINIDRDLSDARSRLNFWESRLHETRLALEIEGGNRGVRFEWDDRAQPLTRPSSPTLTRIAGVAIFAGLAVGAIIVLLAELLDHSFRSVDQAVDDLRLPVLGAVAEIVTPADQFRRRIVNWVAVPSAGALLLFVLFGGLLAVHWELTNPAEFESFRQRVLQTSFLDADDVDAIETPLARQ